jgi:hypothetical protein
MGKFHGLNTGKEGQVKKGLKSFLNTFTKLFNQELELNLLLRN